MSSDEEGLLTQALHIENGGEEFDLDIPPVSGHEYLRRVQLEAKNCPQVVVADIDRKKYMKKQNIGVKSTSSGLLPAPSGLTPSLAWQREQTANFSEVRQKLFCYRAQVKQDKLKPLINLPNKDEVDKWCRLCFGQYHSPRLKLPQATTASTSGDVKPPEGATSIEALSNTPPSDKCHREATPPVLSIVCHLNQATVIKLLEYHINWFEATGFTHEQGQWFYALLASLEKPLSPETCSLLRTLARDCANLRATLEHNNEILQPLNLFICLVARYFDQLDLADHN